MDNLTPTPSPALTPLTKAAHCGYCDAEVHADDAFCNNCAYPITGDEKQQQAFVDNLAIKEIDLADYHEQIIKGGNSLYWVAGLFALGTVVDYFGSRNQENVATILIVDLIIVGMFIFLAGWSRKKPFAALVSGISLYAIITLLLVIANPVNLLRGIIFKIAIISMLIKGIKAAMDAEKLKKENHLR